MTAPSDPLLLSSPAGLSATVQRNGSTTWLTWNGLRVNLYPGTALEAGPANLWVRRRSAGGVVAHPLLGPASGSVVSRDADGVLVEGDADGLSYRAVLTLAAEEPAWCWRVSVVAAGDSAAEVDVVVAADVALARPAVVRTNEYYVCQYLDHTPLLHPEHGWVVAVRQNLAQDGCNPWLLLGSLGRSTGFTTDALQLHGLGARAGLPAQALARPELVSTRLQHEHALVALQAEASVLDPGQALVTGFFGFLVRDHGPTSPADLALVDRAVHLFAPAAAGARAAGSVSGGEVLGGRRPAGVSANAGGPAAVRTLFDPPTLLAARDLDADELAERYGPDRTAVETDDDGDLSFFTGPRRHVVLRRKELSVLRPHAHILRTGNGLVPDPLSLTTTTTMAGGLGSFVTQGQVAVNRFLSTTRGYLGLQRAFGHRLFVEIDGHWHLLDVPSAFEMEPDRVRWVYAHDGGVIEVTTSAYVDEHVLTLAVRLTEGPPRRFLSVHHVGAHGDDGLEPHRLDVTVGGSLVVVAPHPDSEVARRHPGATFAIELTGDARDAAPGDDSVLFVDGLSRDLPYLCVVTAPALEWGLRTTGALQAAESAAGPLDSPAGPAAPRSGADDETATWDDLLLTPELTCPTPAGRSIVERVAHQLPWLVHNALVHYLAPRGIEQYTGGAWGTRDASQGPVELLLALERYTPLRSLLLTIYAAQEVSGEWPQAFGFHADDLDFRMGPAHGDVALWPVVALGQYLLAARDGAVLDEEVAFYAPDGTTGYGQTRAPLLEHALRALALVRSRGVAGTRLVAYGHGDWNDSLQPADPAMAERLCSSWTVTLHVQALRTLAAGLAAVGLDQLAEELGREADDVLADFQRLLMPDGVLAGYASFDEDGSVRYLIHPSDDATGLRYSLLPMIHAVINDMLTPEQADHHVALIAEHLMAPDGAHLFDRPPAYRGGTMVHFQRAETATFFGREIGLMYMHAHLRYAEALHRLGRAEDLMTAFDQANAVGLPDRMPQARRRQANCYYSSSDAAFADRYEAAAEYQRVLDGSVAVEGGWRVYSSGAGITYRLVLECLLGLRRSATALVVDPVLPRALDQLEVRLPVAGRPVTVRYVVGTRGHGPVDVQLNGTAVVADRLPNPYRTGGLEISMDELTAHLRPDGNEMTVTVP
jgi:cellobiose phosphorylase